jgi:hypothetical protein
VKNVLLISTYVRNIADLEWYMASNGIVTDSELEEDPRAAGNERKQVSRFGAFSGHSVAADSDDDFDT